MHLSIIHKHVPNVCLTSRKRLLIVLIPYWQRSPNDFIPCVNAYQRVKRASNVRSTCMWRVSTVFNEYVAIAQRSSTVLQACVYRASHLVASRWQYKSPITCFQSLGNKIINANFYGNTKCHLFLNVCATRSYGIPPVCLAREHYMSRQLLFREMTNVPSKIEPLISKSLPRLWFFFLGLFGIYHQ